MAQITNAELLNEITLLKDRMKKVEEAVEGKNGGIIATVMKRVDEIDARLTSFEQGIKTTLKVGGVLLAILSFLMPLITLIIQHYWH